MTSAKSSSVSSLLFESFDNVPLEWGMLCKAGDLGMDPRVLSVFQRTLKDQCHCWGIVVLDADGGAIGCAALCLFATELVESSHPVFVRLRDGIRRFLPNLGRVKVLFCGLPVPSGSMHLRLKEPAHMDAVVAEINHKMKELALATGSRLLVFKELDDTSASLASSLASKGYVSGAIPPLHVLKGEYPSFEKFCQVLKSRYRAQIKRSQKKLQQAGFEVLCGRGKTFFTTHFNGHVHQLYVAMRDKAKQKLELMPADFFLELAHALDEEVLLTLIRRNEKVCAFSFSITRGQVHYNLYSGMDYALNNEGDLYFNLFYNDMNEAFRAGATELHLGQTSDMFKSRLGTVMHNLRFFVRMPSPVLNYALRLFAPVAFPTVLPAESKAVFAAD